MTWELIGDQMPKPKSAIMVSKYDHCLNDLLYRFRTGQLNIDVTVIISKSPDLKNLRNGTAFRITTCYHRKKTKLEQEAKGTRAE